MDNINLCNSIIELENKLNAERAVNVNSSWTKLDKSTKLNKLVIFCNKYNCNDNERINLLTSLKKALEQNKLQKIKDVNYDIITCEIVSIPILQKIDNYFIIKTDKRVSTSKSLPIKNKIHNTKKKKHKIDNKD